MASQGETVYVVDENGAGQRADKYLCGVCDISRSRLQALIEQGYVTLNGDVLKTSSRRLENNDILTVRVPETAPAKQMAEDIPLNIVYEDDDLLVINKQAGLVVHPGAGNHGGTLVNALLHHCGDGLSGIGGVERPGIVHRLDKDTSGLMLVAKNDYAHQYLAEQLADRSLSRTYMALVVGVPMPVKGVVDRAIGRDRHNRLKMSVVGNAKREARTHYRVERSFGKALSLVECTLETGRTHQIRVHMEAIGHPLIGDPLYGAQPTFIRSKLKNGINLDFYDPDLADKIIAFPRQFLHACRISFLHPATEEEMFFEVELPSDMVSILKLLDK